MAFSKNWISKNWKSIGIHCWTSINESQWKSINEFIDGPSMNMVPFLWALLWAPLGRLWGPMGPGLPSSRKAAKTKYFAPYGDSGRFDVTGWSGNILRIEIQFFVSPNSGIFKIHDFLRFHYPVRQKIGDSGSIRRRICFRSILSRQNGLNRHMEQNIFQPKNTFFQFFDLLAL